MTAATTLPSVSVIIPTLNEAEFLPATLAHLAAQDPGLEIIASDGGSRDATRQLAMDAGVIVLSSDRAQRAAQMNLGARTAHGDVLLFLHADTQLPSGGLTNLKAALQDPRVGGGAFARRFTGTSTFLRCTCELADWRGRILGWHLGDQAMFVRRPIFDSLGGFADMDQFEDLDFSRRLRRISRTVTLRPPVVSHGRRFERHGPVATTARDLGLTLRYLWRGASDEFRK
ncbi:MAG: TIGR04283 family arsenosugar biosynthesis glycosyltransferase [Chthoniobacteraceae bacterium]